MKVPPRDRCQQTMINRAMAEMFEGGAKMNVVNIEPASLKTPVRFAVVTFERVRPILRQGAVCPAFQIRTLSINIVIRPNHGQGSQRELRRH